MAQQQGQTQCPKCNKRFNSQNELQEHEKYCEQEAQR